METWKQDRLPVCNRKREGSEREMEKKENKYMVKISVDTTELDMALEKTKQLVALMEKQQKLAASSSKAGLES